MNNKLNYYKLNYHKNQNNTKNEICGYDQNWVDEVINKSKKYITISKKLDKNNHDFLISGSTAIIFYLNELLNIDKDIINDDIENLRELIKNINRPTDLDFKYIKSKINLFNDEKKNNKKFLEIDIFKCDINNINENALFEKHKDIENIFKYIDFEKIDVINHQTIINDVKLIGLEDLLIVYNDRIRIKDLNKIKIIKFIIEIVKKYPILINKYIN